MDQTTTAAAMLLLLAAATWITSLVARRMWDKRASECVPRPIEPLPQVKPRSVLVATNVWSDSIEIGDCGVTLDMLRLDCGPELQPISFDGLRLRACQFKAPENNQAAISILVGADGSELTLRPGETVAIADVSVMVDRLDWGTTNHIYMSAGCPGDVVGVMLTAGPPADGDVVMLDVSTVDDGPKGRFIEGRVGRYAMKATDSEHA